MNKNLQPFRTEFSESIFNYKYKHENAETWEQLSRTLIEDVCRDFISKEEKEEIKKRRNLSLFFFFLQTYFAIVP